MALSTKVRFMIAAPLIGLVGLGLGLAGVNEYNTSKTLRAEGVEVPGKVVDGKMKSGRKGSKTYYLTVSYSAKAGDPPIQHEFQVSQTTYNKAEQESPEVKVRILPSDPKVAQLVGEESSGMLLLAIGAGALVASLFLFLQLFKKDKPAPIAPAV
jgi:Protein of unknown function (DUF3592)